MRTPPATLLSLVLVAPLAGAERPALDLSGFDLVDLSHAYDASTLYWPTSPGRFERDVLHHGPVEAGFFYSAGAFSTPEHGGTHLDAPIHFAAQGATADAVPLERLVAPAIVLDVSARAVEEPDYRLGPEDVAAFERDHGRIPAGTIVLLRTGWSARWPDARRYLGDDTPGDASRLHFPAYGEAAARLLVEARQVAALGVDTASLDHGPSSDFPVHRVAAAADVPGFENLTRLERLPATGAYVIALPLKIAGGSGGPLRAVALVPR